jgi:hypothetical protein
MSRVGDSSSNVLEAPAPQHEGWPPDVELIISALQAGEACGDGGEPVLRQAASVRRSPRMDYRVRATLRLFSDIPGTGPWRLYTRDASSRGLGFLTPHRLPLGYGGNVDLRAPNGQFLSVPCTLLRCREVASGWFDGALYFNRAQPMFAVR